MDILRLLKDHNIYYTLSGPNAKKGNCCIPCPLCNKTNSPDTSEHMGISLTPPHIWGCWRNPKHRGKNISDLIQILLNCSWTEAKRIVENDKPLLEKKGLLSQVSSIFERGETTSSPQRKGQLFLPSEFKEIKESGVYKRFHVYLQGRGFSSLEIQRLKIHYKLKSCLRGDFAWRLIFPIYYQNKLVSWTGRAIREKEPLRYLDLSLEKSVRSLKECLYDLDNLIKKTGEKLFVLEGCFDVLNFYRYGLNATCLFTISMSENQKYLLYMLSKKYERIILIFDKGFETQGRALKGELSFLKNLTLWQIPSSFKANDPGEMSQEEIQGLLFF